MFKRLILVLLASSGLLAACAAAPEGLDRSLSKPTDRYKYRVEVHPLAEQGPLNQIHSWEARVLTAGGAPVTDANIEVSGGMPRHGHGLPTQPAVIRSGEGRYVIGGVKFSMTGWWELKLKIDSASNGTDTATFNLIVKATGLDLPPHSPAGSKP